MADKPIDKSDVNKIVDASKDSTNQLVGAIDKLVKAQQESDTPAAIIKQSLPEVLTESKFGKMADAMQKEADKDRSKDEKIQKTQNKLINSVKKSVTIQNMQDDKAASAQKLVDAGEAEKEARAKRWEAFQKTQMFKQGKALANLQELR